MEQIEQTATTARRFPIGAEVGPDGGVHFRVWAPRRSQVKVALEGGPGGGARERPVMVELDAEDDGYHSVSVPEGGPGTLYRFQLAGKLYPDPVSRFQPEGPEGPSQVIAPSAFPWTDSQWRGVELRGQVLYEMHIGTFTKEGTWRSAMRELPALAELGVTSVELMPVAEFAGRFGWGYDGVDLFAPYHHYGSPDDMRRFVDRAHGLGIGVLLDVVYNHFGAVGDFTGEYSSHYRATRNDNAWGGGINFDDKHSGPVREFFLTNAAYWIDEFHLDGLRIDATQEIHDASTESILTALTRQVRVSARGRATLVIAENEPQESRLARDEHEGGSGFDALWNDDFHHVAMCILTGRGEGYYADYRGTPQELISCAKRGYLYQGQRNLRQGKARGLPTVGLTPETFVTYLQNHDQVGNSLRGERVHLLTSPALYRAMTAVWLLAPGTPMFFQGQEFAASTPFTYFSDTRRDLADEVRKRRLDFLDQFPSLALPGSQILIPDPFDPGNFDRAKLDDGERRRRPEIVALHRDLLNLRRADPVFREQGAGGLDGAVLAERAFVIRHFSPRGDDRILVVNLGDDLLYAPVTDPLLAPSECHRWRMIWSSEDPRYGGHGTPDPETDAGWRLPGRSAIVLAGERRQEPARNGSG
jgi:maltooligosyltrehalose trehalohydrolase